MLSDINNRGDIKPPLKKNFNFKTHKENTVKSLNDVEFFLNNFKKFHNYLKIYKLLK